MPKGIGYGKKASKLTGLSLKDLSKMKHKKGGKMPNSPTMKKMADTTFK